MARPLPDGLDNVYVYTFTGERYRELAALWSFYVGEQHDHCHTDWHGRKWHSGQRYLASRVRMKGFAPHNNRSNHDDRRPNVPQNLPARVVDRFTEMTCGRPATLVTRGDENSTLAVEALAQASDLWDAVAEMVTIGGAVSSAAILPVVMDDGQPSHEVFKPHSLYVRKWANRSQWIPAEVIHQTLVTVETVDPKTHELKAVLMVRTRMWTETHMLCFRDVERDTWETEKPLELDDGDDAMLEHDWGRCPIVWHQNIRNTESPDGQHDLRNAGNLELSDNADKLASHAVKATRANTEPTVVRSDRDMMFQLHPTIAKGVGNEIRTSEAGKVSYLETDGKSVEMAWDGVDRITLTFLRNCNCVIYDVDMAMAARGSGDSGEALMQRAQSMQKRCNRKRVALNRTIRQLLKMWLHKMREAEISSEDDPVENSLVLPPRCYTDAPEEVSPEDEDAQSQAAANTMTGIKANPGALLEWREMEKLPEHYAPHKLGKGWSIDIRWPPYSELTPMQIQAYLTALATATGNKAVLSQQTGVELAVTGLGLTDGEAEKRRILEEKAAGLSAIQPLLGGDDPGRDAEVAGATAADDDTDTEEEPDSAATGGPPSGKTPAQ